MTTAPRIVMISSTSLDLQPQRQHVRAACEEKLCLPRMMDHLPASGDGGLAESLAMVDQADVYLGIFAYRYGFVPPGHTKSITHQEYERAVARGIPIGIFLIHPEHPVLMKDIEDRPGADYLSALKKHLEASHTVKYFRSPEELHSQALLTLDEALRRLEAPGAASSPDNPLPTGPAPLRAGENDPDVPTRVPTRDLFRLETHTAAAGDNLSLTIDLGFLRIWLRNAAGVRLPLVCGCAAARSEVLFEQGKALDDPTIAASPDGTRVVVEFGKGDRPCVLLEAQGPRRFMEGRAQVVFAIDPREENAAGKGGEAPPSGTVVVSPQVFRSAPMAGEAPAGLSLAKFDLLLNAYFEQRFRRSRPSRRFSF